MINLNSKQWQSIIKFLIPTSILILFFQNCGAMNTTNGSANNESIQGKANFTWINDKIIQPTCVACHNPSLAFSGLDFTTYSGVLDAVSPRDPSNSSLYTRSFSTKFFVLSSDEKEIIRIWILNGATQ